jgi:hypothetical protein
MLEYITGFVYEKNGEVLGNTQFIAQCIQSAAAIGCGALTYHD